MRQAALATLVAATALVVAACADSQTGQALSIVGQPATSSPSSSSSESSGLVGLNACSLLTDAEAKQAVPTAGPHTDQGEMGGAGTSNCQWVAPATNDFYGVTFSITVRSEQSIKDVKPNTGDQRSDVTMTGGRPGVVLMNNQGACFVAIAVGSGRVDLDATSAHGASDQMCAVDSKLSDFVEPKLPAS